MANAPLPDPVPAGTRSWIGATSLSLGLVGLAPLLAAALRHRPQRRRRPCGAAGLLVSSARTGYGRRLALGGLALSLVGVVLCLLLMPTGLFSLWPFRAR